MMPGCSRRLVAGGIMEQTRFIHPILEQPDMPPSLPLFVGLDYSQHDVQLCVLDPQGQLLCNRPVADSADAIDATGRRFGIVKGAALEACTGAANLAEELADRFGWPVHLAHPGFVSRMKQSPDKTDFSDARVLADLERVGYLPRVWIAPQQLRELRTLVRDRQQRAAQRRNLKRQIGTLWREHRLRCSYNRWTRAWFAWLQKEAPRPEQARWVVEQRLRRLAWIIDEIRIVEARLEQVTAEDATSGWLRTLQGIGPVTAWTLRAEIGRFDRFRNGKQLARSCGLTPCNRSSGVREADAGLIRAANPEWRRVLIEAAWLLARLQPRWRDLAQRLKARGKPSTVAIAAVANRFVRWLYHEGVRQHAAA
jgi:transposase